MGTDALTKAVERTLQPLFSKWVETAASQQWYKDFMEEKKKELTITKNRV